MKTWKKIILKQFDTMHMAIKLLDHEKARIILIADDTNYLIGTVTDGDIRRALLQNITMESPLSEVMHKNPIVAKVGDSEAVMFSIMKKQQIMQIPIVDDNFKIVGVETIKNIIEKDGYDNPVLLMAGGYGTRLHPLTKEIPKPLLKVGNKALLETILEHFISAGFHEFYISVHYKAGMLKKYFGDGSNWGVSINYIDEEKPLGTAGALSLLPNSIPNLPVVVMNGDILTKVDIKRMLDYHVENNDEATICVREYDFQVPYGVVNIKDNLVTSIVEKPTHNFFINAGIYILSSNLVKNIKVDKYLDMPNLLRTIIESSGKVNIFPIHEYWLDIGQIEQYEKAQFDIRTVFL